MNRRFFFLGAFTVSIFVFVGLLFMLTPSAVKAIPAPGATPGIYVQGDDNSGHNTTPEVGGWLLAATPVSAQDAYAIIGGEDRWLAQDIYNKRCQSPCQVTAVYNLPSLTPVPSGTPTPEETRYFVWDKIDSYLEKVDAAGRKAILAVNFGTAKKCGIYGPNPTEWELDGYTPDWMETDTAYDVIQYLGHIEHPPAPTGQPTHTPTPETIITPYYTPSCVRLNWLDPDVKAAIEEFVQAFALKYDNDDRVEAIEIPSGAGGEALPWMHGDAQAILAYQEKWCPGGDCSASGYCPPDHDESLEMCWAYGYMNWLIDRYSYHFQNKPLFIHSEGTAIAWGGQKRQDMAHWYLHAVDKGVGLATAGLKVQNNNGWKPDGGNICAEYYRDQIKITPISGIMPTPDSATAKYFTSNHHFSLPFSDTVTISMEYSHYGDGLHPQVEPFQHDYLAALNALSHGTDYILPFAPSIMRPPHSVESEFEVQDIWEFINRFAGRKADNAPGAWIAFNQSEENYLTENGKVLEHWCSENPGDYQFLLRNAGLQWGKTGEGTLGYIRIDDSVDKTDCKYGNLRPWWGKPITPAPHNEPCAEDDSISYTDKRGAIVRYLNPATGRDAIYLDLDDAYRNRFGNEFTVKVTYWDGPEDTTSAFRIYYHNTGGANYVDVPKSGAEEFRTFNTTLTNAAFGNGLSATNNLTETVLYDIRIEDSDGLKDYLHMVFIEGISPLATTTPTPTPTATPTPLPTDVPTHTPTPTPTITPNPFPTPDFVEDMGGTIPGNFDAADEENGAFFWIGEDNTIWFCEESIQVQNWPNCWVAEYLTPAQPELTVETTLGMSSYRQTMTGIDLITPAGWGILVYFDMSGYLHVMCSASLCEEQFDHITSQIFNVTEFYKVRVYAHNDGGRGELVVWVKPDGAQFFFEVYSKNDLSFSDNDFNQFQIFSLFGINNGWYPELAWWDAAKAWWTLHPTGDASPPSWVMNEQQLFALSAPTETYQHGVNGYTGGADTHIVTTNWEWPPVPHHTFPVLYLRTSRTEDEIKSSLISFEGIDTSDVVSGTLSLYYTGQSVNGGDVLAHIAGLSRDWIPSETTWVQYKTGNNWQTAGAKGPEDRWFPSQSRTINYQEVGTWIDFDVSDLVRQGVYDFILYPSSLGVNKDVQFASNEYWDVTKRPKLSIQHVEWGVP